MLTVGIHVDIQIYVHTHGEKEAEYQEIIGPQAEKQFNVAVFTICIDIVQNIFFPLTLTLKLTDGF